MALSDKSTQTEISANIGLAGCIGGNSHAGGRNIDYWGCNRRASWYHYCKGHVADSAGEALIGVSVAVKGEVQGPSRI